MGTSSTCTNDAQGGFDWTFTSSDLTIVGSDTFITTATSRDCTLGPSDTETILWTDLTSDSSFSLFCGPVCTYNELNRVSYGIDIDGRYHITSVWHVPNSNVITEIKRVYTGPFIDFWGIPYTSHKEVITLQ